MRDGNDLYHRIRRDLHDMGVPLECAAMLAYEALQASLAGVSIPKLEELEEQAP